MSTITPEQLIYDLQTQIIRLEKELDQAQKDIKDFENLAIEWKKGFKEQKSAYKIELENLNQVVKELEKENNILKEEIKFLKQFN